MKIELFKKKNKFTINPNFYWKIAVSSTILLIIASFVFGYCFFVQINQAFVLPTTNDNGQNGVVSKDRIEKVLNYFSDREQKSNEILNSSAPVVDPSL